MKDNESKLNKIAVALPSSGIRKYFAISSTDCDCISLSVGEPDFATPIEFVNEGYQSAIYGHTHYTENAGLEELRYEISKYLQGFIQVEYDPQNEIIVTNGCSEGIDIVLRCICNAQDEVIIPQPNFVCYSPLVRMAGATPIFVDCDSADNFKLCAEQIEKAITSKTKCILLSYPNNPTGNTLCEDELKKIAKIAIENDIIVISDEIYGELTYGKEKFHSISAVDGMRERTIVLSGFSKAFAMTGWRIGYVCAPKHLLNVIKKLHQYCAMSACTTSQYVALSALKNKSRQKYIDAMRNTYNERRKFLVDNLNAIGIDCPMPDGTFYAFANVASVGMDGERFANKLLASEKVAVVPGISFGANAKDYVRISFASSLNDIQKALDRIDRFVNTYQNEER